MRLDQAAFLTFSNSASCNFDHLRRIVAGNNLHPTVRQEAGVDSSSTAKLKNTITGAKCRLKFLPHRGPLGLSDLGAGECLVVAVGDSVEWGCVELCRSDRHRLRPPPLERSRSGQRENQRL